MIKENIKNIAILVVLNIVGYILHYFVSQSLLEAETAPVIILELSYFINAVASLSVCFGVLLLKKQFETQIGFVFLGLSVLKMIILYFLLNPNNANGNVNKIDALAFFIPFGLNLVMEQIFIVKLLKISDLTKLLEK